MKKILFIILLFLPGIPGFCQSTEQINPQDPNYNIELNDILQNHTADINTVTNNFNTVQGYFSNGILNIAHGGTGTTTGPVPSGVIVMWSGTIASIPSGWVLCDGTNSTPDLRDRFIVGARQDSSGIAKTNVTGSLTQSGNGQLPATTTSVTWPAGNGVTGSQKSTTDPFTRAPTNQGDTSSPTNSIAYVSFGTGSVNIAVYYALAFIMKT